MLKNIIFVLCYFIFPFELIPLQIYVNISTNSECDGNYSTPFNSLDDVDNYLSQNLWLSNGSETIYIYLMVASDNINYEYSLLKTNNFLNYSNSSIIISQYAENCLICYQPAIIISDPSFSFLVNQQLCFINVSIYYSSSNLNYVFWLNSLSPSNCLEIINCCIAIIGASGNYSAISLLGYSKEPTILNSLTIKSSHILNFQFIEGVLQLYVSKDNNFQMVMDNFYISNSSVGPYKSIYNITGSGYIYLTNMNIQSIGSTYTLLSVDSNSTIILQSINFIQNGSSITPFINISTNNTMLIQNCYFASDYTPNINILAYFYNNISVSNSSFNTSGIIKLLQQNSFKSILSNYSVNSYLIEANSVNVIILSEGNINFISSSYSNSLISLNSSNLVFIDNIIFNLEQYSSLYLIENFLYSGLILSNFKANIDSSTTWRFSISESFGILYIQILESGACLINDENCSSVDAFSNYCNSPFYLDESMSCDSCSLVSENCISCNMQENLTAKCNSFSKINNNNNSIYSNNSNISAKNDDSSSINNNSNNSTQNNKHDNSQNNSYGNTYDNSANQTNNISISSYISKSSTSTIMIAILVPIGALVLIIIGVFFYCKLKSKKSNGKIPANTYNPQFPFQHIQINNDVTPKNNNLNDLNNFNNINNFTTETNLLNQINIKINGRSQINQLIGIAKSIIPTSINSKELKIEISGKDGFETTNIIRGFQNLNLSAKTDTVTELEMYLTQLQQNGKLSLYHLREKPEELKEMEDLIIVKKLGKGGNANVFQVRDNYNDVFALKLFCDSLEINSEETIEKINCLISEVITLKDTHHLFIIDFYGIAYSFNENKVKMGIVEELMEQDLKNFITTKRDTISLYKKFIISSNLLKSFYDFHRRGYIHQDVKPQNILINSKDLKLKISDLGAAMKIKNNETELSEITEAYACPENILHYIFDSTFKAHPKNDVWSLGLILYNLFVGDFSQVIPWLNFLHKKDREKLLEIIKKEEKNLNNYCKVQKNVPELVCKLINEFLQVNMDRRIDSNKILIEFEYCRNFVFGERMKVFYKIKFNSLKFALKKLEKLSI